MLKDFKDFLLRGNLVDLAVAVVIGLAFAAVVTALVEDLITPLLAALFGQPDFSRLTFTINDSVFRYGDFLNAVIAFVLVAAAIYFVVVVPMKRLRPAEREARTCPECLSEIPVGARRCAFCGEVSVASAAEERAREARRATVALARDLVTLVDGDLDACALESAPRLVVPLERESHPGRECEHVRAHRLELLVGNLDELDAAAHEQLDESDRHERRVGNREIVVEQREQGHEVQYLGASAQVGKVEDHDLDARQRVRERSHALVVRAVTPPGEQCALVEPDEVAPLGERGRLELRGDRNARLDEVSGHGVHLDAPAFLPGPEQDRAAIRDEGGIVKVDLVGAEPDRRLTADDFRARFGQKRTESLVLLARLHRIGLGTPPVGAPGHTVLGARRPHEYAAKGGRHALAAIGTGGNLHPRGD
jgi:large conductance mechanosensitive channel